MHLRSIDIHSSGRSITFFCFLPFSLPQYKASLLSLGKLDTTFHLPHASRCTNVLRTVFSIILAAIVSASPMQVRSAMISTPKRACVRIKVTAVKVHQMAVRRVTAQKADRIPSRQVTAVPIPSRQVTVLKADQIAVPAVTAAPKAVPRVTAQRVTAAV